MRNVQKPAKVKNKANMTANSGFFLRWNNHTTNILQVFMEHLTSENLVDVTVSCEGKFIKAHKMILSACSPYFQELFQIHDVTHPVVIMNGVKFYILKQVIEFMYKGEIKVLETELNDVLAVAESLQVKGLSSVRNKYEKGDIQNSSESVVSNSTESCSEPKKRKLDESGNEPETRIDIKVEPPDTEEAGRDNNLTTLAEENDQISVAVEQKEESTKPKAGRVQATIRNVTTSKMPLILPKLQCQENPSPVVTAPKRVTVPKVIKQSSSNHSNVCSKTGNKIRRPPNAFMIFANKWRKTLATLYKDESNAEISCKLGMMWKSLDKETKEHYYKKARQADLEHKEKYPGYVYSPQEARARKYSQCDKAPNMIICKNESTQCNPIQFVKQYSEVSRTSKMLTIRNVFMTDKNDASTPVMIALGSPEVSMEVDKSFDSPKKMAEAEEEDDEEEGKLEIKEEVIDSSDDVIMKIKTEWDNVESTMKDDHKN